MEKVYYYIYKITILRGRLKDHYYIGQHMTDDLNDGYLGSGRKIKDWFKYKNRIEGIDYIKEILCFCKDWEEMQEMEDFYLGDKWKDEYPECLNLTKGGKQHFCCKETRQKQKDSHKGQIPWHKGKINVYSEQSINNISIGTSIGIKKWISKNPEKHNKSITAWCAAGKKWLLDHPEEASRNAKHAAEWNKDKNKREIANKKVSKTNKGMILMTDGKNKPIQVILLKQQEFYNKGYYRCHRNGTPW